jgi:ferredoxin
MLKLKIDNKEITVKEGTTVLHAAESAGIEIPSMCFMEGYSNHPSCMVCLVKDNNSGQLYPSCATRVVEGMEIISNDEEVHEARREALELLLSDHVGDCEAPCRYGCPAFMNIPLMNRLIGNGRFEEAIKVVKDHIALPLVLGYICPAPCEKVCRRKPIDDTVSICQLKKYVAAVDLEKEKPYYP